MFTIDNVPVCFFVGETMTEEVIVNGKSELHYFPAIVTAFQPGYSQTNWDYGSDFELASKAIESLNLKRGVKPEAASLIVNTSMFPQSRITLDDIYAANGETVPISVR